MCPYNPVWIDLRRAGKQSEQEILNSPAIVKNNREIKTFMHFCTSDFPIT